MSNISKTQIKYKSSSTSVLQIVRIPIFWSFALCCFRLNNFVIVMQIVIYLLILTRFVNYKKGALDSQLQVIKLTSCLLMVGGSLRVLLLLPPLKLVAEILLKVALSTKIQIKSHSIIYCLISVFHIVIVYY